MTENNKPTNTIELTVDKIEPTINHTEYQKMVTQFEAMAKELQDLKDKSNSKKKDFTEDVFNESKKAKLEEEQRDKEVTFYADVKSNFNSYLSPDVKEKIEAQLKGISRVTDRCNYMAKAVIRRAFGSTDALNSTIEGFKSDVTDTDSAFYSKYMGALEKLKEDKSSVNAGLFNQRASELSSEELEKIMGGIIDYRTRKEYLQKAKDLGLLKA